MIETAAAAPVLLDIVQGEIRLAEHFIGILILRAEGDAGAHGDSGKAAGIGAEIPVDAENFLFNERMGGLAEMHHEDHEFISADAADVIVRAEVVAERIRNVPKHRIAHIMAVGVVDLLVVIGIEQQHGHSTQIQAGLDEIIAGPVIGTGELVMGSAEIQVFDVFLYAQYMTL